MSFDPNKYSNSAVNRGYLGINPPGLQYYQNMFQTAALGLGNAMVPFATSNNDTPTLQPSTLAMASKRPLPAGLRSNNSYATALDADGATMAPRLPRQRELENGVMSTNNQFLMTSDNPNAVTCYQGLHDTKGRAGIACGVLSSGENQTARRLQSMNAMPGAQHPKDIVASDTNGWRQLGNAPLYSAFDDAAFNTQSATHLYDRKMMTGVFVNTNTGQMYETYEDDLPPPNTDASMEPSQLQRVNPRLVALQGGIDYNRPPRQKTEVQLNMPGVDHGPNVWGDQLYADRLRQRELEMVQADMWRNQGGNFSTEPIMDGRPTGYVGFQNMIRFNPYATPTQRGRDDTAWQAPLQSSTEWQGDKVVPVTTITKPDLTPCQRSPAPSAPNGVDAEWVIPLQRINDQDRDQEMTGLGTGAAAEVGGHIVSDMEELRPFLKEVMSVAFPVRGASSGDEGSYVHMSSDMPDSLKESLMAMAFSQLGVHTDVQFTNLVGTAGQSDGLATQRDQYGVVPEGGMSGAVTDLAPALRVYELDLPDTMRSALEGKGMSGSVFAMQDGQGQWYFAGESDLPDTMRSALEAKASRVGGNEAQDGWMLPRTQTLDATKKDAVAEARRAGQVTGAGNLGRPSQGRDMAATARGDKELFAWITPTQVPNDGQTASPFDGFTVQHKRKQAREMTAPAMPPMPVNHSSMRWVPQMRCDNKREQNRGAGADCAAQQRVAYLTNRPTYFTEASIN